MNYMVHLQPERLLLQLLLEETAPFKQQQNKQCKGVSPVCWALSRGSGTEGGWALSRGSINAWIVSWRLPGPLWLQRGPPQPAHPLQTHWAVVCVCERERERERLGRESVCVCVWERQCVWQSVFVRDCVIEIVCERTRVRVRSEEHTLNSSHL